MAHATNSATVKDQAVVPLKQDQSPLGALPTILILKILYILGTPRAISKFGTTCRLYHAASQDNRLWRDLFSSRFQTSLPQGTCTEERACLRAYKCRANFMEGVYATRELEGDTSLVRHIIQANGNLIAALDDGTIKIWDIKSGAYIQTLEGHSLTSKILFGKHFIEGRIQALLWADGHLMSKSYETIKIWDLEAGKCIKCITTPGKSICSFFTAARGHLITERDSTISIRNLTTNECRVIEWDRTRSCRSLTCIDQNLILSDNHGKIAIWDLNTCEKKEIIPEQSDIHMLFEGNGNLIISYETGIIMSWDLKTGNCLKTLKKDESLALVFRWIKDNLNSLDYNAKFSMSHAEGAIYFNGQQREIRSALWTGENLILSYEDYPIKILDFSATDRVIFTEIANLLRSSTTFKKALERFYRMPLQTKQKIDKICQTLSKNADPANRNAFLAQAIEDYLKLV